ncbi:MAG: hypothetical protein ACREJD_05630 [Phycisphaerales bacterium]
MRTKPELASEIGDCQGYARECEEGEKLEENGLSVALLCGIFAFETGWKSDAEGITEGGLGGFAGMQASFVHGVISNPHPHRDGP